MLPARYIVAMLRVVPFLALAASACAPSAPQKPSDCAGVVGAGPRADCMVAVAIVTFKSDPKAGEALLEAEVPDPLQRDMVYMRVGSEVYPNEPAYCRKIQTDSFKATCKDRQARPHLLEGRKGDPPPPNAPAL